MEVSKMTYLDPTFKKIEVKGEDVLTSSTPFGDYEAGSVSVGGIVDVVDSITIDG